MWILTGRNGGRALRFRVPDGATRTVGRARGADFVIDAPLVSRVHCRLRAAPDALEVEDLASTNGTFVNDRRVQKQALSAGDRLRVGRVELQVERSGR